MKIVVFVLFTLASAAVNATNAPHNIITACPGSNVTISWAVNVNERVCAKFYDVNTGEPTTVKLWKNILGKNKDLGTHTGGACFDLGPVYKLKAGFLPSHTIFYLWSNDEASWSNYPAPSAKPEGTIDPCIPLCEQIDPPTNTVTYEDRQCTYICGGGHGLGNWELFCEGITFDRETGKPKITP